MLKHNLLLIFRNFTRDKTGFLINLAGLSTGLASAILIYLWVNDELSFDRFHARDRQLYQVMQNAPVPNGVFTTEGTPGLLSEALAQEMPEVEESAVAAYAPGARLTKGVIAFGDAYLKARELHVSRNYFKVFTYHLLLGDKDNVLTDKYSVVLSNELALKLFRATENIVGKTVEWQRGNLSGLYTVTGVFETPPANSSAQFDLLFTYELLFERNASNLANWGNSNPMTYVVLKEGTDLQQFNDKIKNFSKAKFKYLNKSDGDWIGTLFLQRYSDKYLYNRFENGVQAGGRISYVKLFSIIAVFILFIACINFMNLSTAKALNRLKEIGVKKAVGADRKTLIFQHLGESLLISFFSLVIALLIVAVMLPEFNNITGKQMTLDYSRSIAIAILAIVLITGLISGSYPALYLSGFKPATVLKGGLNTHAGEQSVRKGLVVFQFTISIILIVCVLAVHKQIEFIHNKNLGYNKDNVIRFINEGKLPERLETFFTEIKKIPGVLNASTFGNDITANQSSTSGVDWEGKYDGEDILFANLEVDYDLIELFGFELKEGRSFSKEFNTERSKIIFNEAAIAAMGMKDPIGKTVKLWGEEKQIIGVVKNFHFESLYEMVKPCLLQLSPGRPNILVKIQAGMERVTIDRIEKLYQQYNDGLPFEYRFVDEDYQALYASEERVAVLSRYFAGMVILISSLGLLGLATFTSRRRLKEISIRKILGSTEFGIVYLLSVEFTKLVFIAVLISLPVSYILLSNWLSSFAFRVELKWWFFMSGAITAVIIAWATIGMQTIKAAKINPARCLKDD